MTNTNHPHRMNDDFVLYACGNGFVERRGALLKDGGTMGTLDVALKGSRPIPSSLGKAKVPKWLR